MKLLSDNLVKICSILSDLNFHDGDSIGKKLNITRSAVWKSIKKLQEYGINIISIKNKGYCLNESLFLIDKEKIIKEIANPNLQLDIFESINSTNNFLKENISNDKRRIAISECQTSGRGRMGRAWHSPFGKNIYLSYSYLFDKDISQLYGLSLVVGIAAINAIKEIGLLDHLQLKWPNDGIYNNQKFMGNLVELISESHGYTRAIIGIGINVNMTSASTDINQEWTSLKNIFNKNIDRKDLCISLIHNLNYYLEQFEKYGLNYFHNQWLELDGLRGKNISLNNNQINGLAEGIDSFGNLQLKLEDGTIKSYSSGEISFNSSS